MISPYGWDKVALDRRPTMTRDIEYDNSDTELYCKRNMPHDNSQILVSPWRRPLKWSIVLSLILAGIVSGIAYFEASRPKTLQLFIPPDTRFGLTIEAAPPLGQTKTTFVTISERDARELILLMQGAVAETPPPTQVSLQPKFPWIDSSQCWLADNAELQVFANSETNASLRIGLLIDRKKQTCRLWHIRNGSLLKTYDLPKQSRLRFFEILSPLIGNQKLGNEP